MLGGARATAEGYGAASAQHSTAVNNMAKSLSKVQSKVAKKAKPGTVLHEASRDARKLRRAAFRAEKLDKLANSRAKQNQPLLRRLAYFREASKVVDGSIECETLQIFIQRLLYCYWVIQPL